MKRHYLIAVPVLFALSACATITKGSNDTIKILSTPDAADVSIKDMSGKYGDQSCTTPCVMELNRKTTYIVDIAKEGFSGVGVKLVPKMSADGMAGMAGNLLVGGIIGAAVDGSTGAMNDLRPNPIEVKLNPTGTPSEVILSDKDQKALDKAKTKDASS